MRRSRVSPILILLILLVCACTRNGISERDSRRDSIRNNAEVKRRELMLVAGEYRGTLAQDAGNTQRVALHLEIKDIPAAVDGQVDAVMVPTLSGFLRFGDSTEYIGFAVEKAEFDPKSNKLDVIASNSEYKSVILSLKRQEPSLSGSWTAPGIAASGKATLERGSMSNEPGELRGEYGGILFRESRRTYQYGHLTLTTSIQPPEGLKVGAVLRVIFGDWKSTEYLTYHFEKVQFNPVTGQLVLKAEGADVMFSGFFADGRVTGEWFSNYTGKLGAGSFQKLGDVPPPPTDAVLFEALRGTYTGAIKNTNPASGLPERAMVSFVTSQDLGGTSGIKVTGSLRLYLGGFDSLEYIEKPFADVQYNFFTRKLVAKTAGEDRLTLKADVESGRIVGNLFSDALGEMATVEVKKQ